jgi:hypothetical protein
LLYSKHNSTVFEETKRLPVEGTKHQTHSDSPRTREKKGINRVKARTGHGLACMETGNVLLYRLCRKAGFHLLIWWFGSCTQLPIICRGSTSINLSLWFEPMRRHKQENIGRHIVRSYAPLHSDTPVDILQYLTLNTTPHTHRKV